MNTPNLDGICVLVDGGCLNNNKPVSDRKMYGSLTVFYNDHQVESTLPMGGTAIKHEFLFNDEQFMNKSNNQAELETMYDGLLYVDALRERMADAGRDLPTITVLCDSELALGVASGAMKISKKSHEDLKKAAEKVRRLALRLPVIFQHVDNQWVKSVLGH